MKLLVGVLLLLLAFVAAAIWQRSWREEAIARRGAARENAESSHGAASGSESTWGRVIIGRPSGAEPEPPAPVLATPSAAEPRAAPAASSSRADAPSTRPASSSAAHSAEAVETKVVVKSGQSLSSMCRDHYGTSRPEVVQALATYNKLKHPDEIREGQTIVLPPLERLVEKDRR